MRAINATVVGSSWEATDLCVRSSYLSRRSEIKRTERRKQRRALQAELSTIVAEGLEHVEQAERENRTYVRLLTGVEKASFAEPLTIVRPAIERVITVIRKRAFSRPVAEQMLIAA
jgi:aspartate aminotransferase-like enzyme